MRRHRFPKPYADVVARLRVPAGFLLVIAFAWLSRPSWLSILAGLPVCLAGLLLRGWAAGHLEKNRRLATCGPYALMRNPLYAGTLLVAAGLALAAREPWLAILFGAVFVLVYLPVIELEEQHLRHLFPEFARYAERVPLLWPARPYGPLGGFRWSLFIHNREYEAVGGFLLGLAWLVWRAGPA